MRILVSVISICILTSWGKPPPEECDLKKRDSKVLGQHFDPGFGTRILEIPLKLMEAEPGFRPGDCVHIIQKEGEVIGYRLLTQARGRFDLFDYAVIYNKDLTVLDVSVKVYRSSHGAAICQRSWLRQFEGYEGGELTLGKEINAISGATISATSMVADMQRCHGLMLQLRDLPFNP
jgi:hypothetical protein